MDLNQTITYINDVLMSDSGGNIPAKLLAKALTNDAIQQAGPALSDLRLPTQEECDMLVMGNDDGEIPEKLKERFPRLNSLIEVLY